MSEFLIEQEEFIKGIYLDEDINLFLKDIYCNLIDNHLPVIVNGMGEQLGLNQE